MLFPSRRGISQVGGDEYYTCVWFTKLLKSKAGKYLLLKLNTLFQNVESFYYDFTSTFNIDGKDYRQFGES